MVETINIPGNIQNKESRYEILTPQLTSLMEGEDDLIANLANITAALKSTMGFFWVGFYLVKGNQLVLGPFQGPVACTRIAFGKGVCGACWQQAQSIIVPDVDQFPGHIACSSESRSEIVIPVIKNNKVELVLDVDSDKISFFDEVDKVYLEKIANLVADKIA